MALSNKIIGGREKQVQVGTTMRSGWRLMVEEKKKEVVAVKWWTVLMVPMRLGNVLSIDL